MTWVRRTEQHDHHECEPPTEARTGTGITNGAIAESGSLWRCDSCGCLWRVSRYHVWKRAPWWLRWKYRNEGRETVIEPDSIVWRYPEGRNET